VVWAQLAGPEDGVPVFFHLGTPGSRSMWEGFVEAGAERGLRHICCSRPGWEGSDRQPGRSFASTAADIEDVADELGLERFYVSGLSFGATSSLACAALLPDRVLAALSMASLAPRAAEGLDWIAGMCEENIEEFETVDADPGALEALIERWFPKVGVIPSKADIVKSLENLVEPVDVEVVENDLFEASVIESERLAGTGIWGWYDDDLAACGDWGFDPAAISVPVSLWHGGQDRLVPISHGEWLAAKIPGVRPHFPPDLGHMSLWVRHYGDALDELIVIGGGRTV
jgi:pimeloyl-ACP methyl ester carboxylesterase